MARRIKSKAVRGAIDNPEILEMFNAVMGTGGGGDINLRVVYPKYAEAAADCDRFVRVLETMAGALATSPAAAGAAHRAAAGHLAAYIARLRAAHLAAFSAPDLAALHPPSPVEKAAGMYARVAEVTADEYAAFAAVYHKLKESEIANTVVLTCKNLVRHKRSLQDAAALKDRFILQAAGMSFAPLDGLPEFNLKQLYVAAAEHSDDRRLILLLLHKLYTISHAVYETLSSPDIDVDDFIGVINASLEDIEKRIPRCGAAFKLIRESIGLLKGNFGSYYKDYVASDNPTVIMENFVLDVSNNAKASPTVTAQFRKIISHYKAAASQHAQDPKMRALFQQVDRNFQELEKESNKADAGSDSEGSDVDADAPAVGGGGAPAAKGGPAPATRGSNVTAAGRGRKGKSRRRRKRGGAGDAGGEGGGDGGEEGGAEGGGVDDDDGEGLAEEFSQITAMLGAMGGGCGLPFGGMASDDSDGEGEQ